MCTCNGGYTGSGTSCSDINECTNGTHNCDANATCTNTGGSFSCSCNAGYTGNGVSCTPVASDESFSFPLGSDTIVGGGGQCYQWSGSHYVEGSRTTSSLTSVSSLTISAPLSHTGLTCDNLDVDVLVNGTTIGSFVATSADTTLNKSFTFAAISSPSKSWTIRYDVNHNVASGCGAICYDPTASTVTLSN